MHNCIKMICLFSFIVLASASEPSEDIMVAISSKSVDNFSDITAFNITTCDELWRVDYQLYITDGLFWTCYKTQIIIIGVVLAIILVMPCLILGIYAIYFIYIYIAIEGCCCVSYLRHLCKSKSKIKQEQMLFKFRETMEQI